MNHSKEFTPEEVSKFIRDDFVAPNVLDSLLDGICDMQQVIEYRQGNNLPFDDMRSLLSKQLMVAFYTGIGIGIRLKKKGGLWENENPSD